MNIFKRWIENRREKRRKQVEEQEERQWKDYCARKEAEAAQFIRDHNIKIGERYRGTYFLGGTYEGVLTDVWNGMAVLKLYSGGTQESIDAHSLVPPDQDPPPSTYKTLQEVTGIDI